jgi:predicted RNA-binding Zn-ribbon protein involved in translation (DUF1610 family)
MNSTMKDLRALATEIAALQAKAKSLGLFAHDRKLLECPACGLMENVAAVGGLFTCRPESLDDDTGLRFEELSRDRFRCPGCGATVRESDSSAPVAKKTKKGRLRPPTASR